MNPRRATLSKQRETTRRKGRSQLDSDDVRGRAALVLDKLNSSTKQSRGRYISTLRLCCYIYFSSQKGKNRQHVTHTLTHTHVAIYKVGVVVGGRGGGLYTHGYGHGRTCMRARFLLYDLVLYPNLDGFPLRLAIVKQYCFTGIVIFQGFINIRE